MSKAKVTRQWINNEYNYGNVDLFTLADIGIAQIFVCSFDLRKDYLVL